MCQELYTIHLGTVQNRYAIPLYWLAYKDPYDGLS